MKKDAKAGREIFTKVLILCEMSVTNGRRMEIVLGKNLKRAAAQL